MDNYTELNNGVIHQNKLFNNLCEYNSEYSQKYNNYGIKGARIVISAKGGRLIKAYV